MAGTWEYGPPWKRKIIIFNHFFRFYVYHRGCFYLCILKVLLRCSPCKKKYSLMWYPFVSFCVLILIQLCTKSVERGRGFYVRWWIRWDSILCAWYGSLCEEGGRARQQPMIAIIDSRIWNLTGVIEIWLVARRCQFASGVSQTLLVVRSSTFTTLHIKSTTLPFLKIRKNRVGAWHFLKEVYRIDVFFSRRHKKLHLLEKQHVRPERGASGRWRVCQPDVWKLRCWWRRRDVFTPKNVFFT